MAFTVPRRLAELPAGDVQRPTTTVTEGTTAPVEPGVIPPVTTDSGVTATHEAPRARKRGCFGVARRCVDVAGTTGGTSSAGAAAPAVLAAHRRRPGVAELPVEQPERVYGVLRARRTAERVRLEIGPITEPRRPPCEHAWRIDNGSARPRPRVDLTVEGRRIQSNSPRCLGVRPLTRIVVRPPPTSSGTRWGLATRRTNHAC